MRDPIHLLKDIDLTQARILELLELATQLKIAKKQGTERARLSRNNIALIFEKPSTRTRSAFEVAAQDQGAGVTYVDPASSHMGVSESVEDTARVLGRLYDGIAFRGFQQATVETLARYAGVPVWNALTDLWHPTQALADMLTMREHAGKPLTEVSVCYLGDGHNNVARSLLMTGALLGLDVRIAAPAVLHPDPAAVEAAAHAATRSGGHIMATDDIDSAVRGADFLYTDVWVSMGEPDSEWDARVEALRPFRIDANMLARTGNPKTQFLHCLPSVHDDTTTLGRHLHEQYGLNGVEVSDDVFRSPRSLVFEQAENRMHTIKAVLAMSLDPADRRTEGC
ncbi:ornithine carbamoyltransferase [Leifsonia sp. Root112D2]|uniref:ornithine carbamoyltransferase n=1 Tax=Leifsonia sp. Root112D2 TaxID=1736426 RepID=UPI0009E9221F